MQSQEYYIEYTQVGNNLKVAAIDPLTQIEAIVVGPAYKAKEELTNLAVKKLEFLIEKQKEK